MSLIYITGVAGSGKSTVIEHLSKAGYETHGVDEEGFADWAHRETGDIALYPEDESNVDFHEWYKQYSWVLNEERIHQLLDQSNLASKAVFLAGVADGEDSVRDLFSHVIYLSIDQVTIKKRIEERENNDFGKTPEEMADTLKWYRENDPRYKSDGSIVVDATQPVEQVVKDIVQAIQ
ncbi:MAG: AAA family ATPase [Candidatus Saccharimonas sp.]